MALNAEALLQKFAVHGRFYEKPIAGVDEKLRDRLELAPRDWPLSACIEQEPDLLVIMMNPGASRALDSLWDSGPALHAVGSEEAVGGASFVPAVPDRTQYQIMQLMLMAQSRGRLWQHARVLNLSDLRTPKSGIFIEKLQTYSADDSHSLFSEARKRQCAALLGNRSTPVLCAWGLSPHFVPLARKALAAIAGHPILGLSDDGVLYRHPLPQRYDLQQQWLERMADQMEIG